MDRRGLAAASLLLVAATALVRRVQQALNVGCSRQNVIGTVGAFLAELAAPGSTRSTLLAALICQQN